MHLAVALAVTLTLRAFGIGHKQPTCIMSQSIVAERLGAEVSICESLMLRSYDDSNFAEGERLMLDVILIAVGCGCFAVAIAYAYACDRL